MAWRFVEQPNGLLARFSDIVDDFTHVHMTDDEVLELAFSEFNIGRDTCLEKIGNARREGKTRWDDEIHTVRVIHGHLVADERIATMSIPADRVNDETPAPADASDAGG